MNYLQLNVPPGWEVVYNCLFENTHDQLSKQSKDISGGSHDPVKELCCIRQGNRSEIKGYWVIYVDWMAEEKSEGSYCLSVCANDRTNIVERRTLPNACSLQKKLNDFLNLLMTLTRQEVEESKEVLFLEPKSDFKALLFPVLTNWRVMCNLLCDLSFGEPQAEKWMFGDDLVFLHSMVANAEGNHYILSVDWKPNYAENGRYRIQVIANDYEDGILHTFESKNRLEIRERLFTYQDIINSFRSRTMIGQNLLKETELYQALIRVRKMLLANYPLSFGDEMLITQGIKQLMNCLQQREQEKLYHSFEKILEEGFNCISFSYLGSHYAGCQFGSEDEAYGFMKRIVRNSLS